VGDTCSKHGRHGGKETKLATAFAWRKSPKQQVEGSYGSRNQRAICEWRDSIEHRKIDGFNKIDSATSRHARKLAPYLMAIAAAGCSTPGPPQQQASPLVTASCPERQPLLDDSFGAWVLWAQQMATTYDRCRAAQLGR
jgi:hypothetical protein